MDKPFPRRKLRWCTFSLRNFLIAVAVISMACGWLGELDDTAITDAGLIHLESIATLDHVDLSKTAVTDEGIQRLSKALPNCRISPRRRS